VPDGQFTQLKTDDAPDADKYDPVGQEEQDEDPVADWYVPATQGVQEEAPVTLE